MSSPRLPPVKQPVLRQKLLQFDENPTDSAAETDTDLANIIELPEKVNEKNKSLEATELDIDQQICETRDTHKPELVYRKREFLAVRNVDNGFWLCQAVRDVYRGKSRNRIQWLTCSSTNANVHQFEYHGKIEFGCILMNVNLEKLKTYRFRLADSEKKRIEDILRESLAAKANAQSAVFHETDEVKNSPQQGESLSRRLNNANSGVELTEIREHPEQEKSETPTQSMEHVPPQKPSTKQTEPPSDRRNAIEPATTESASPNPIQRILRNESEKTKVKFTVEMEERERKGKPGYRIDIWEAQASDIATQGCPDNTQGQRGSLGSSTPDGSGNPPRNQIDLSYINEMSPFRQAQ